MTKSKSLKILSILSFLTGTLFFIWAFIGLNCYFNANSSNRLPPAGSFIDGHENFSFAIMSDSGFRDEPVTAIIRDIKNKKVNFILHLGDQARRLSVNHFEHLLQSLEKTLGDVPFYAVPGNHDTTNSTQNTNRYYNRAFGQSYYWFSYGDTLFIALDTSGLDFNKEQQAWLKNVLFRLRSSFKNCILFMHAPPLDPRPGESYAMYRDSEELAEIIKPYNITALFAGHIHEYIESKFQEIPIYILPPSGQKMRGKTSMYGYILCEIKKDSGLSVTKIDVTKKKGRNYLLALLSTELDGITSALISFFFLSSAFLLIFLSLRTTKNP